MKNNRNYNIGNLSRLLSDRHYDVYDMFDGTFKIKNKKCGDTFYASMEEVSTLSNHQIETLRRFGYNLTSNQD